MKRDELDDLAKEAKRIAAQNLVRKSSRSPEKPLPLYEPYAFEGPDKECPRNGQMMDLSHLEDSYYEEIARRVRRDEMELIPVSVCKYLLERQKPITVRCGATDGECIGFSRVPPCFEVTLKLASK